MFRHGKDYKTCELNLKKDFSSIVKWLHYNGLFFNASKTKTIIFGSKRKIRNYNMHIYHNNTILEPVESIKYLGITMDRCLTWSLQIKTIVKKASGTILLVYEEYAIILLVRTSLLYITP